MSTNESKFPPLEIVHLGLIVVMFIAAAAMWNQAPDKIPVHWNIKGEVDRYGGKFEGLILLPLITLGLYFLLKFLPAIDPGKDNYAQFKNAYGWIRFGATAVMAIVHAVVFSHILGHKFDAALAISMAVGGLFLVLGNFMGKLRPNWFVGVRTPWTLSSKLSWTKTHRQAGWLFMAMGIGIIAAGLIKAEWAMMVTLTFTCVSTAWLVFYSWYVWKDDDARIPPANTSPESAPE